MLKRNLRLAALAGLLLAVGATLFVERVRRRADMWLDVAAGGEQSPSLRTALVETVPYDFQPRVRRWLRPEVPQIPMQLTLEPPQNGSFGRDLALAQTVWSADHLNVHYSRLAGGKSPHPEHVHDDEEILLPVSGIVEILREGEVQRIGPGWLVYHASRQPHTIRAVGPEHATYLAFRWNSAVGSPPQLLEAQILSYESDLEDGAQRAAAGESVKAPLLDGPTLFLERLYAHLRSLPAGDRIPAHEDDHDAILLLLSGTIETQGATLTAPAVSFNPAFSEHGMDNPGPQAAQYVAIDLTPR